MFRSEALNNSTGIFFFSEERAENISTETIEPVNAEEEGVTLDQITEHEKLAVFYIFQVSSHSICVSSD